MMTRKDHEVLAEAFRSTEPEFGVQPAYDAWREPLLAACEALQTDNPRFDRMRFLHAASN